jgi:uncharacterized protein (TIGR02265 family)
VLITEATPRLQPAGSGSVDLAAHIARLPPGATCKGLYFKHTLSRLEREGCTAALRELGPLATRAYTAFGDFSYADYMRLQHRAALAMFPGETTGHALRRLGATVYEAFYRSHVGRVMHGAFGSNFGFVARTAPKGWGVSMNFGSVRAVEMGPRYMRYEFRDMPVFVGTMQAGVCEGAMAICGVTGRVEVDQRDIANVTLHMQWQ